MMVLRTVDHAAHTIAFHTDRRAAKVAAIAASPRVAVAAWDAPLQLRLHGAATIVTAGAARDAAWAAAGAGSRDYASTAPPGTVVADPAADAGDGDGRANFAVLEIVVDRFEWLELARGGHRRAAYVRDGAAWRGGWLVP